MHKSQFFLIRSSTQPTGLRVASALNVLRTSALRFTFLRLFYVIGIRMYKNCIKCIFLRRTYTCGGKLLLLFCGRCIYRKNVVTLCAICANSIV